MEASHEGILDTAPDKRLQTTISIEMEVPLQDQSLKRRTEEIDGDADKDKKALKKRRSSLCTKRRSIVGNRPAEPSTDNGSQNSSTSGGSQEPPSEDKKLTPNPANLKMDAAIKLMETQIERLDKESSQWQELLESHVKRKEEANMLASSLELPESSIPDDVKQLGQTEYLQVKPLDLHAVRNRVTDLLTKCQFDKEACCQDLRLIKNAVESLKFSNSVLASRLQQSVEENRRSDNKVDTNSSPTTSQGTGSSGPKENISKFILSH